MQVFNIAREDQYFLSIFQKHHAVNKLIVPLYSMYTVFLYFNN